MKKILPLFLAIFLLILPGNVLASSLSLSPSSGTFNKGCPVSLKITVDTEKASTDGTDAILIFDNSRFLGQSIATGSIYPDFPGNNIDNAGGKITISGLASVNDPFAGKGTLATVNFKVADNAPEGAAQINFDFDSNNKKKTTDSNVVERGTIEDTLNSVVNGNYVIGTGACAASPTPASSLLPRTGGSPATPSAIPTATPFVPRQELPPAGTQELTSAIAIVGGILTILGILGLALL